ncbi:MAG: DUF1236 domain-containing protein [Thioclava marina]|uniref:SH3b domain-containing protein n=1 Tax=Thioclava marina TaxID=1915077 RepID=A0ABX3MJI8_9RHOB|nr:MULTISPECIES: DUF1236 domain-containing protein [Thioclava]TNE85559.1 MAG: DUF1236 domain-containing protein [Paracoccaceae bacterium]MBC7144187.1 DUF1236 domain-containing protein [Thioclava marina]MBD3803736.1 DUF1236 domain-containing protein [Thioclava sp.]OOY11430.1 hypothetical protein BMG00_17110 [Thioclava marina]OOY26705.1 hypothetical protein BMI90_16075 [Thioclava sp. L04-15]
MTRKLGIVLAAAASTTFLTGAAFAQSNPPLMATAQGAFELHSGAAPQSMVIETVEAGSTVMVEGCLPDGVTCKVNVDGKPGWAPAAALGVMVDGQVALLSSAPQTVTIKQIEVPADTANKDGQGAAAVAGAAAGGAAGAALGGPVGAVIGALVGSASVGAAAKPEPATITWVEKHPVAPVYLTGDLEPGVVVPDVVALTPVPDSTYSYVNINDKTVFVNPDTRAVVYVVPAQ